MPTADNQPRIGFIGAGRMATALANGLISSRFSTREQVIAADVSANARERFAAETGARVVDDNAALVEQTDLIVLAVKPQQMTSVLADIQSQVNSSHLIVSIAAGVPLAAMTKALGPDVRAVRVMPNTPCLVGAGAAGFATGGKATDADAELVSRLLETVGIAFRVPEAHLDAVTGLSGSGPAFVYQFIEALSDGGVAAGLPRDLATQFAAQTVLGAARMVLETGEHPAALKDAVTSPGGTTIAGLHELERGGLRAALMNAVTAATARSRELGQPPPS